MSGFPAVVFAGEPVTNALRVGYLSTVSSVLLDAQTRATFAVRYVFAPHRQSAGCAFAVVIGGATAAGPPITIAPCQAVSEVDVSSFAPLGAGAAPSPPLRGLALNVKHVRRCEIADLSLRVAGSSSPNAAQREIIAVQNRSLTACKLPRAMHAQLLGPQGRLIVIPRAAALPLRMSAPGDVVMPAGQEASLTLTFTTLDAAGRRCPASRAVALVFPDGRFTASTAAVFSACTDQGEMQQTPLRAGVPLPGFE